MKITSMRSFNRPIQTKAGSIVATFSVLFDNQMLINEVRLCRNLDGSFKFSFCREGMASHILLLNDSVSNELLAAAVEEFERRARKRHTNPAVGV